MMESYSDFLQTFRCFPVSLLDNGKPELEAGGKIVLPPSALQRMATMNLSYPLLFEIQNHLFPNRKVHCGVQEFIAPEGRVYVPYWMMQNLAVKPGDFVKVQTISLPLGTFVKFQPQSKSFLEISNPRAVLESMLRRYATLGVGETIMISYNGKEHFLTILELLPRNPRSAVSIIETDINVEFAPPTDMTEEELNPKQNEKKQKMEDTKERNSIFNGKGRSLSGKMPIASAPLEENDESGYESDSEEEDDIANSRFKPFSGIGYSLKGK